LAKGIWDGGRLEGRDYLGLGGGGRGRFGSRKLIYRERGNYGVSGGSGETERGGGILKVNRDLRRLAI